MEIIIAVAVAGVAAAAAWAVRGRALVPHRSTFVGSATRRAEAEGAAEGAAAAADAAALGAQELARLRGQLEEELAERRSEIVRLEERILQREESLEQRLSEVDDRERSLIRRQGEQQHRNEDLDQRAAMLSQSEEERTRELERISGMSRGQAKQGLLRDVEAHARHDAARIVRQVEQEARLDADRRVRNILSACMQRLAGSHAAETTVSLVNLPSDDMKGRIIGREGRNIRALENITGVDFIIDETPSAVVLSSFDGVRREIAKLTLEKLIQDGRIHPARIEEAYYQAKSEIDNHII